MNKFGKTMVAGLATFFLGTIPVFAKEVSISDLEKRAEELKPGISDIYVIGEYAFTSDRELTTQDVMLAARSIDTTDADGKTNEDDIYGKMTISHIQRTRNDSFQYSAWSIVAPKVGTTKITDEEELDIHYIDYIAFSDPTKEVEPKLQEDAKTLNEKASTYGFNSIKYENHTLTFDIQDLSKQLVGYADSGIVKMFTDVVSGEYGFEKITYTSYCKDSCGDAPCENNICTVTKNKNDLKGEEPKITTLAAEMLLALAAKENGDKLTLTYQDVANKSTTATVVYKNEDGIEFEVTYTLKFEYNIKEQKEADLTKAAEQLDKSASTYGFKKISYKNGTATFEINDTKENLSKFASSGIIDLFQKYITGATEVVYTAGGKSETIKPVDASQGAVYAANVLCLLVTGNKDCSQEVGLTKEQLTLGQVAGKEATADITYVIGEKTEKITYTLKFTYNLIEEKDETLTGDAQGLNIIVSQRPDEGFSEIVYDPETKTATFTISNKDKLLKDFNGKAEIIDMFQTFVTDAESITWSAGNQQNKSVNLENVDYNGVVTLASKLLCAMAGKDCNYDDTEGSKTDCRQEAIKLKLEDVMGKEATATVKYKVGDVTGTQTYTLKFVDGTSAALNQVFNEKKTFID